VGDPDASSLLTPAAVGITLCGSALTDVVGALKGHVTACERDGLDASPPARVQTLHIEDAGVVRQGSSCCYQPERDERRAPA
jgi:hypothetical protein